MNKKILLIILTLTLLIMSGCIHVDAHQKLKRNGNTDLIITYSAPKMILDSLKEGISTDFEDMKNVKYEESSDSIKFIFKNINEEFDVDVFDDDEETFNDILFNKENFNIEKEFRFPFYYFTYTINLGHEFNMDNEEFNELNQMLEEMFKFTYTVEVFGKITDTNGEKLSKKEARFNIVDTSEAYVVEFRDFFLFTWIGSLF